MSFDYSKLQATSDRLIARFGKPATLTSNLPAGGSDPWNPGSGGTETTQVTAVQTEIRQQDRDGTLVQADDLMFLVSTANEPSPTLAKTLTVGSETYQIVRVAPLEPGNVTLLWKLQVRK